MDHPLSQNSSSLSKQMKNRAIYTYGFGIFRCLQSGPVLVVLLPQAKQTQPQYLVQKQTRIPDPQTLEGKKYVIHMVQQQPSYIRGKKKTLIYTYMKQISLRKHYTHVK